MSLLPQINFPDILQVNVESLPKKCLMWNFDTGDFQMTPTGKLRVSEDEKEILEQLAAVSLMTERGMYAIHDFNFGSDIHSVIGFDRGYVEARMSKLVREALTDRRFVDCQVSVESYDGESVILNIRIRTYNNQVINEMIPLGASG